MPHREGWAQQEAQRLFPYSDALTRSLLGEMLDSEDEFVVQAFETLLESAGPRPSVVGGFLPGDGPTIDPHHFGPELLWRLENCWYASLGETVEQLPSGLPKYSFYRLPKRLDGLADGLERINQSPYGSPKADFDSYLEKAQKTGDEQLRSRVGEEHAAYVEQMRLPESLRKYAERLRRRIRSRRKDFVLDQEKILLETVERRTGRPHLPEISTLLAAVYGSDSSVLKDRQVTDKVLADRRDRYRASGKTPVPADDTAVFLARMAWLVERDQPSKSLRKK